MVLHYNNIRECKSDESKKILENEPTNKQSLAFTSFHQAAVSSESSCDPDDVEFNLRWCTLLDRSVFPWLTKTISRRSCMDEGRGAREWSPPQVLLCPYDPQGISENFGGEDGKMVVETTGGYPEKGK